MLTKWILGNFKSVADEMTLELKPITVLVGANSSGKSTILQSILAVSQTMRASPSGSPLVFNGQYTRLGYIFDVIHKGEIKKPLILGFEIGEGKMSQSHDEGDSVLPLSLRMQLRAERESEYDGATWRARLENLRITWARRSQNIEIDELGDQYFKTQQKYAHMRLSSELKNGSAAKRLFHHNDIEITEKM